MRYLLLLLLVVACVVAQEPPPGPPPGGGVKGLQNPAVTKELKAYKLSLDGIRKFANAQMKVNDMRVKNPDLSKRLEAFNHEASNAQAASLDEVATRFERQFPRVSAAIRAQGLTPKDYTLNLVLILEATFSGVLGGQGFGAPPAELSAENVAFLKAHVQEVVTILQPAMQPMMPGGGQGAGKQ